MMTYDITDIAVAIIGLAGVIITAVLVPLLNTKVGATRWAQLQSVAATAVRAAEQMGAAGLLDNVPKLDYALQQVNIMIADRKLSFNPETVRAAIEAAVGALKREVVA